MRTLDPGPVTFVEGTANAAAAAGVDPVPGIWPGARYLNVPLPDDFRCADIARGIRRATRAGASVIGMGFGAPVPCAAAAAAIVRAVDRDIVVVAAGGVDREIGSPPWYPAGLPHVLTVGAIGADLAPTDVSSRSPALDVMAPGWRVLTASPVSLDPNGSGYALVSGTGIAAAMTTAAVAWVRAARPGLDAGQVGGVIRRGAVDVGAPGRDEDSGAGVVSVPGALAASEPPRDPAEPNDDIAQVDGSLLGHRGAALQAGHTVRAGIDGAEDPVDVYRLALPPGTRTSVRLRARTGDPDLIVFGGKAMTVTGDRILALSRRSGSKTDGVTLRNRRSVTRHVYVGVGFTRRATRARYALSVRQQSVS